MSYGQAFTVPTNVVPCSSGSHESPTPHALHDRGEYPPASAGPQNQAFVRPHVAASTFGPTQQSPASALSKGASTAPASPPERSASAPASKFDVGPLQAATKSNPANDHLMGRIVA
jgi:hypothetical protein